MIVGLIKLGIGVVPFEEFRNVESAALAVTEFCGEYNPPLLESDYTGIDMNWPYSKPCEPGYRWAWNFDTAELVQSVSSATIDNVKAVYLTRRIDGDAYFEDVRAGIAFEYMAGKITGIQATYIENKLITVLPKLILGDWLTASFQLDSIVPGGVVSEMDVQMAYTQERHESMKSYIQDYLSKNYGVSDG